MATSIDLGQTEVLFLDGGLGTSLEDKYGMRFDESTPLWSSHLLATDQETLLACQADFAAVPVDIILTATYQASVHGFANTRTRQHPTGIGRESIAPFIRDAVRIAYEAGKAHGAKVALSVGPYGACMVPSQEYSGKYDAEHDSLEALQHWHLDRLRIFNDAGAFASPVSYVAVETVPRTDEIIAIRRALDESDVLANGLPFWISCVYPGEEDVLPDGRSVQTAVAAMVSPALARCRPWGLGINCTKVWKLERLVALYEAALADFSKNTVGSDDTHRQLALVLYPDGTNGEVYNTTTKTWELPGGGETQGPLWEDQLADVVRRAQDRGFWKQVVVGGCCKASEAHLSRLRQRLQVLGNANDDPESNG